MELASKYNPADVEGKWYQYWLDNKLFSSKPDGREPYTVVIPPPNVTGVLHMGHMLNNTIRIYWYAVHAWKERMPAGCREQTMLPSPPKPKW